MKLILALILLINLITVSTSVDPFPDFNSLTKFSIRNSCQKSIVVFLDRFKPPCDRKGKIIPFGQCSGGFVSGGGWQDVRNGNIPQQKLLNPGQVWTIPVPIGEDGRTEWCFDEAGRRVCSGSGGWIGVDCIPNENGVGYKCKSGQENGGPYWPGRFEPNFNPLNDVIFYNLSGVDGLNVNMKMFSTGTCGDFDKLTTCNLDLSKCPYPDIQNGTCPSQCQACNRIRSGQFPSIWNKNDFIDPSTGNMVDCNLICAAGPICQDRFHVECAQRVEGSNQNCCKTGECGGKNCRYNPVIASKKWCDYIHGLNGGQCDIYCWAYDDAKGTRACRNDGNINLDVTCSFSKSTLSFLE